MRKILVICMIFGLVSCGGSLSEEQRQALKKEMERREVKRISEEQIFKKALEIGRTILPQLERFPADSLAKAHGVNILFADSLMTKLTPGQRLILEAYINTPDMEDLSDNVQNAGDTIIFSSPVIQKHDFKGVWFINIPRKKIVFAL